jgi:hypothetical protein
MTSMHQSPKNSSTSVLVLLATVVLILASCNLPNAISSTPTSPVQTALPTQAIETSLSPSETIPVPQNSPTPVLSLTPTATVTPVPGKIVFAPGTTAAVRQGSVQPGQVITYTLDASQSQPMILILDSQNFDVYLGVLNPNGSTLLDPVKKWNRWQWVLPKTGVYTIQVIGGATTENYTLTAKVAQLVSFASGTNSITLNGTTTNGYVISYALSCKSGQVMTATLNVPAITAYLDIFGIATGPLLTAAAKANTWTGSLPESQLYIIEVIPNNGQVVNYSLTITVP